MASPTDGGQDHRIWKYTQDRSLAWRTHTWSVVQPTQLLWKPPMQDPAADASVRALVDAAQTLVDRRLRALPTDVPEWLSLGRRGNAIACGVSEQYDADRNVVLRFWAEQEEPDYLRRYFDVKDPYMVEFIGGIVLTLDNHLERCPRIWAFYGKAPAEGDPPLPAQVSVPCVVVLDRDGKVALLIGAPWA